MNLLQRYLAARQVRKLRGASGYTPADLEALENRVAAVGPEAIPFLLDVAEQVSARESALRVLARLISDRTLPEFLDAVSTRNPGVVSGVGKLLAESRNYDPVPLLDVLEVPAMRRGLDPVLAAQARRLPLAAVLDKLTEVGKEARLILIRVLEQIVNPTAIPRMTALLGHADWWVRLSMCRLLARFDETGARKGLIRALADERPEVRLEALKALRSRGAGEALPDMIRLLGDGDLKVQTEAIDAVSALGDASAVPHLIQALQSESEYARRAAVEVLNTVATPEAVQDLVRALRDADWWVRVRAADALGSIGGERVVQAVSGLLTDEDEFIRRYAVEILNTVTSPEAVEPLIAALKDGDWWVRERAVDALGRIGDPRATEPLIRLLEAGDKAANLCARALGAIGDERAVEPLVRAAASGGGTADEARAALAAFDPHKLSETNRERLARLLQSMTPVAGTPSPVRPRRDPKPAPGESRPAEGSAKPAKPPQGPAVGAPVNLHQLPEGSMLLGRYRIKKRVGRGGFGAIYLVEDTVVLDELILKVLNPQLSADEVAVRRFAQELKLARRISHPNVIRLYDLIDLGGIHAVSMEYFPGRDLSKRLRDQAVQDPAAALRIASQVCSGLAAAHAEGVIHRDIKPGNILVGPEEAVKLVDFGLASAAQHKETRLTQSGLLIGTPEYMTPEQIRGGEIDHRADIYAVGIILYEMLSGKQPYGGDTPVNILFRHLEGDAPSLGDVVPGIDPEIVSVTAAAMATDVRDRTASAQELHDRLESILARIGPERNGIDAANRRVS